MLSVIIVGGVTISTDDVFGCPFSTKALCAVGSGVFKVVNVGKAGFMHVLIRQDGRFVLDLDALEFEGFSNYAKATSLL